MSKTKMLSEALNQSQSRSNGKFTFNPSENLVSLIKDYVDLNKYSRPCIPAIGGDQEEEVLPGISLFLMCNEDGDPENFMTPKTALQEKSLEKTKELLEQEFKKCIANRDNVPFLASKKLWEGPAHILDIFGGDGARVYAAMGSTHVKGGYSTKEKGVKVFVTNLSDKQCVEKLIADHPKSIRNTEMFLKWMGEDPNVEVDGASFCGMFAMPGKVSSCQMRAIATQSNERIQNYKQINCVFNDVFHKHTNPESDWDQITKAYNYAVNKCISLVEENYTETKVRYAKGMLAKSPWIGNKTILLDVNALKGRDKSTIVNHVKEHGYWQSNDLVVGLLQDIGTGNIGISWQFAQYLLWNLPENFPVNYLGKSMSGRFGFGPAIMRMSKLIEQSLDRFDQGIVDETMSIIFNNILLDDVIHGENVTDKLTMALWNNLLVRNEVGTWVMNFLRRNRYLFQTQGMERINQILPEKRYILDMNALPNEEERISIKLHDGTNHEAITGYLKDDKFWKQMGTNSILVGMFRHPVSDFRVSDVVLLKNPNVNGWKQLSPGLWLNSRVTKEVFVGDTDGDVAGYFPLYCPINEEANSDGSFSIDTNQEDYCVLYSIITESQNFPQAVNVEEYMSTVTKNPMKPHLLEAESVMADSGALVGSCAMLQSQIIRILGHYLSGNMKTMDSKDQVHLDDMIKTIIQPLYVEVAAILELSISLQKKNVNPQICASLHNATFADTENKEPALLRLLANCITLGTPFPKYASKCYSITEYNNNWANAVCKLIRHLMDEHGIVIINEDGSSNPIEYAYQDRNGRFADQMREEDPELCFGTHDNLNWGILNPSGLKDALAKWTHVFNGIAHRTKARVIKLTNEGLMGSDPVQLTNANRCVNNSHWMHIVPEMQLTEKEKQHLANMYSSKIMWSSLGLKVKWNRRMNGNPNNNESCMSAFRYASNSTNAPVSLLAWITAKSFTQEETPVICSEFGLLINALHNESLKSIGDEYGKTRAADWVAKLREFMKSYTNVYQTEWCLRYMSQDFRNEFFDLLRDAATLKFMHSNRSQVSPLEFDDFQDIEALVSTNKLHPQSLNALLLLELIRSKWIPSENDFRKILVCIKYMKPNMAAEKNIWREKTNKLISECSQELMIQCWRIAYNKSLLTDILSRGWLFAMEMDRIHNTNSFEYFFAAWGFDSMRNYGLTSSSVMGTSQENPRVPMFINEKLWDPNGMHLTPKPLTGYGELLFHVNGQKQSVERNQHATGLFDKDGNLVVVLCESLNIMRLILAFDQVSVSYNKLKKSPNNRGMFNPVREWWHNHLGSDFQRYLGRIKGKNLKPETSICEYISQMKFESTLTDLDKWELPEKPKVIRVSYKCIKRQK